MTNSLDLSEHKSFAKVVLERFKRFFCDNMDTLQERLDLHLLIFDLDCGIRLVQTVLPYCGVSNFNFLFYCDC